MELRAYIAERLKTRRIQQVELAAKLKRDPATVNNWIKGRQPIPLDMLGAIAYAIEDKNPIKIFKLAGLFAGLPDGADRLIDMMEHATPEQIDMMERLAEALVRKQDQ